MRYSLRPFEAACEFRKLELFTLDEVATTFRVSRRTMQDYVRQHPFYRALGGRKLFTHSDIKLIQRSVFGAEATATFVGAAVSYLEAGGERLYLKPIIARMGSMPLAKIDQTLIEKTARALYPNGSPATLNRQAFTPIAAVLTHAAARGLCPKRVIERPPQPKGRVRWLTFEEAERLLDACAEHLRPLVMFLLGTGARLSEALYLDWRELDLAQ